MPQTMTPGEAMCTTCPFMSRPVFNESEGIYTLFKVPCMGQLCPQWGWIDPEGGEVMERHDRETTAHVDDEMKPEDGGVWLRHGYVRSDHKHVRWRWYKVKGPRRGQCEVMSPYIEVNCNE